ncbi:MAG: hypothetical protein IID34_12885 [Planctomycetes bacterium]|nr:hypothetical protein [Planctomycetota bacterium]MCH8969292.1 hypothetical protein [Planctomycetota bacterium]
MANQTGQTKSADFGVNSTGPRVLLQDILAPGAYVCHWNGDLLRVLENELPPDELPNLPETTEDQVLETTKVSDDPFIPISQARMAASNFDIDVSF